MNAHVLCLGNPGGLAGVRPRLACRLLCDLRALLYVPKLRALLAVMWSAGANGVNGHEGSGCSLGQWSRSSRSLPTDARTGTLKDNEIAHAMRRQAWYC